MKFKKEDLLDLIWDDKPEGFERVLNTLTGHSRWSIKYSLVFKYDNKYYVLEYSKGATEHQDESPLQYEPDEIECQEVWPKLIQSVIYTTEK